MNLPRNCTYIAAGKPFLATLARWTMNQPDMLLAKTLILLPNRRSCLELQKAYLQEADGKPLLLPRMVPIGEVTEWLLDIPQPMSSLRRDILLTQLVHRYGKNVSMPQAAELGKYLSRFMDEVAREGCNFNQLSDLVPEELSAYWQQTLEFLEIVTHHWPSILEEEKAIDPVDYRNRVLLAIANQWKNTPPAYPIIAAGSTGSQPATAHLLSVISQLPQGQVILSGLDVAMPMKEWNVIGPTHPQYGLKQLLEKLDCKHTDIKPLTVTVESRDYASQMHCLRTIFQPPDITTSWANTTLPLQDGMKNIRYFTADTQFDEACMIAIALREKLEIPGKTVALITPDRNLGRLVSAQMTQFGIDIDDSSGVMLNHTPVGCFLNGVMDVVVSKAAPSPLLALLRHPFAGLGFETQECRKLSRVLEKELLRGIRIAPGIEPLLSICKHAELTKLLVRLRDNIQPVLQHFQSKEVSFKVLLEAHITLAEALANTSDELGEQRLWRGDAGNQMAQWLAEILQQVDDFPLIDPYAYPALLAVWMSGEMFHSKIPRHPRCHVLSPVEARLLHFDSVVLGGLNEAGWPQAITPSPWMSRPMRTDFGLPATERAIGQSAHELFMLCLSPDVLLTRAHKVEGSPTIPSRWWVRMETLIKGIDKQYFQQMSVDEKYTQAKQYLHTPINIPPHGRPKPQPPLSARPRKMRVTAVDIWLRDPYMIYAQYILKLRKLEKLDKEPDASDFGTLVHKALEIFTRLAPNELSPDSLSLLIQCGQEAFNSALNRPAVVCLWWPRFESMAQWIIERELERRHSALQVLSELDGRWEWDVNGKPFILSTRIDRLEIDHNQSIAIIDYKTGALPSNSDIELGLSNQILLEGLVVLYGNVHSSIGDHITISALEYWKLSGRYEDCDIKNIRTEGMQDVRARLEALIQAFDNEATPYTANNDPKKMPQYNNYEHLTRYAEWEIV
jgi:ATP-dependent helicase/nuclease subunit B